MIKPKYIIGIDEAGRGPLAGPVSVGVVLIPVNFDWGLLKGVRDSKKLSPQNREVIFKQVQKIQKLNQLDYSVTMVSASTIDKVGIVPSINRALQKSLKKVMGRESMATINNTYIKLDGGLKAPKEYINQETIIKGDDKELVIGLASIMAKVTRDKYMDKLSRKAEFAKYGLAIHKGYGTKLHRESISSYGFSKEHRQTFCRKIIAPQRHP